MTWSTADCEGTTRFGGARTGFGHGSGDRTTNDEARQRAHDKGEKEDGGARLQGRESFMGAAAPFIEEEGEERAPRREKGATMAPSSAINGAIVSSRHQWRERTGGERNGRTRYSITHITQEPKRSMETAQGAAAQALWRLHS
jgi:hypothetical protein